MTFSQGSSDDMEFAKILTDTLYGLGDLANKDFNAAMLNAVEQARIQEELNKAIKVLGNKLSDWGEKSLGRVNSGAGSYANAYFRSAVQADIDKFTDNLNKAWSSGSRSVTHMTTWRNIVPDFNRLKYVTRAISGIGSAIAIWQIGTEISNGNYTKAANMTVQEVVKGVIFGAAAWGIMGGLIVGGFPPVAAAVAAVGIAAWGADMIDEYVLQPIMRKLNDFGSWLGCTLFDLINPDVSQDFEAAKGWRRPRDPFALDLDGDGIETSAIAGWNGLMFDHNADGIKEATGWVSSDDGLLVLDRNANGTIDSGRELFGDNTRLSNGQLAADAYAALADQDGNGDGKIDASDAVFDDLKVWQDRNHDGISQADELSSLNELGIESISTSSESTTVNQNGNTITATGRFEYADGSRGQTGSLAFAGSNFFTEFSDEIEIPETHQHLPDMHGSGAVRNLREAAVLSSSLTTALEAYEASVTRKEQLEKLDGVMSAWAATSSMKSMQERAEDAGFVVIYEFGGSVQTPTLPQISEIFSNQPVGNSGGSSSEPRTVSEFWQASISSQQKAEYQRWFNIISVLERFNGEEFIEFTALQLNSSTVLSIDFDAPYRASAGSRLSTSWHFTKVRISQPQLDLLERSYNALCNSVYQGLLLQTRLRPFLDSINLTLTETGELGFDFSGMEALMQQGIQNDAANGVLDILEFNIRTGNHLQRSGWNGWEYLGNELRALTLTENVQEILDEFNVLFTPAGGIAPNGTNEADIILGDGDSNTINGGLGDDQVHGLGGDDLLVGEGGNDRLEGGAGNDTLYGGEGEDHVYGGAGDDEVHGGYGRDYLYGGDGNDVLGGGNGDRHGNTLVHGVRKGDYLEGGKGDDVVHGGNYDNVFKFNLGDGRDQVFEYNGTDTIRFGEGIAPSDIELERDGLHLVLRHVNGEDRVTISNWACNDMGNYHIERVEFADGTVWGHDHLQQVMLLIEGGDGDDQLIGSPMSNEKLFGKGGDDLLVGEGGNDLLDGGTGNDTLYGGEGEDHVYGGAGDDEVHGGYGMDYLYGGAGNDVLGGGTGDRHGNSRINGVRKGDYLEGGKGDDVVHGGSYDNIFKFNLGDGRDQIFEYGGADTIRFGEGIAPSDIELERDGLHLVLRHVNGEDRVTISNWACNDLGNYHMERVEFADGTVWGHDHLQQVMLLIEGGDGDDQLIGSPMSNEKLFGKEGDDLLVGEGGNDLLDGGTGNDTLYGGEGEDHVYGGAGDDEVHGGYGMDYLYGGDGNDVLGGGRGDVHGYSWVNGIRKGDYLEGGKGDDLVRGGIYDNTFMFNPGDGRDYLVEVSGRDTIKFGEGIRSDQLWFERVGNELKVSIIGTKDSVTIHDWYGSPNNRLELFTTAEGDNLADTRLDQLVSAMAAFSPPTPGQTTLPEEIREELIPVITSSWQ